MLDTNILWDVIRQPQGRIATRIAAVGERAVATSIIVACELWFGAAKKSSAALTARVDALLVRLGILAFNAPVDGIYGGLRATLEAPGTPIGANDMLIAAHALALNMALVTDNEREFSRAHGLVVENWLR